MSLEMSVFKGSDMSVRTLKSGADKVSVMSRKSFKEFNSYTNQEAKRYYPDYLLSCGIKGNGVLAGQIASNQVFIQSYTPTKDGFNAVFINAAAERFAKPEEKTKLSAEKVKLETANAELAAKNAALEAKLAALEKLQTV